MKRVILLESIGVLLFVLICVSCIQKQRHVTLRPPTSVSKPFAKQKVISDDTPPAYDSTIYAKAIDSPAIALMRKYLPEWDFPPPSTWDKIWFNEYKKEGFLVNYIYADFNGDGKTDLALLLKSKKIRGVGTAIQG